MRLETLNIENTKCYYQNCIHDASANRNAMTSQDSFCITNMAFTIGQFGWNILQKSQVLGTMENIKFYLHCTLNRTVRKLSKN